MKNRFIYISRHALFAFVFIMMVTSVPTRTAGESIIRINGDRTPKTLNNSSEPIASELSPASAKRGTTIRIIGDKQSAIQPPTSEEQAIQQQRQLQERLEADRAEESRKAGEAAEQERLAKEKSERDTAAAESARQAAIQKEHAQQEAYKAEESRKAVEKAEQQLAQRLLTLKAEQERKAAEKAEQERLAQVKAEQENAAVQAAQQAAVKLEYERLAARKAEETRMAAEKEQQKRIAGMKADEERLSAIRKSLADTSPPKIETPAKKPATIGQPVDSRPPAADSHVSWSNRNIKTENISDMDPETIWELYLSAKANDSVLGRTEARVTASKADSDVLLSVLLPHLDSSAGIKQISQKLSNYSASEKNNDYTSLNYNVTARLTLLSVPTLYSLSAAAAGLHGELAAVAAARQNLILKFTDSYFALLKARADKQIARGEINRLRQVLEQSQAFLKAETGDIIAVYEAQSRLDGADADLTKSESNLRLAEQKLSTVVGKQITSIVDYLPQQPAGPDPDDLDWWVATMEKEQPVLRQAREGFSQASEQRKSVKAEYLPILQASGGYDVSRGTVDLPTAEVRQWFVGASVSLPLYSGGETAAKVRRAVASEEECRHVLDETLDQQRENVKQAFYNLHYNISLIKALEQKKASAEVQLAAISRGRKIGTRNAIDVLNAEQAYSVALRDYKYALYDNVIKIIQLKSAAGILEDTDVSGISRSVSPPLSSGLTSTLSH